MFAQSGQGPLSHPPLLSIRSGPSPQGPRCLLELLSLHLHSRQRQKDRRKGRDEKGTFLYLITQTILSITLISQNLVTLNYKGRLGNSVF